jgi:hypothetical protein
MPLGYATPDSLPCSQALILAIAACYQPYYRPYYQPCYRPYYQPHFQL